MRIQDNQLARDLLEVRKKINVYKAQQSCDEHAEMLDDVACELEEEEELTAMTRLYKGRPTAAGCCYMTEDDISLQILS